MKKERIFWETCKANYAHLKENWLLEPGFKRESQFMDEFMSGMKFRNKTVIDYGCGGGHFGLYLLKFQDIKKYIGIDIAERSLIMTRLLLDGFNFETYLIPIKLQELKADILISIACIQHFPSLDHLDNFLDNINHSNIHDVMLNTRYAEKSIASGVYEDVEETLRKVRENQLENNPFGTACLTNVDYINERLNNYELVNEGRKIGSSQGQYLLFRKA